MKNIRIVPYGGLGNRMFQFMFALALQKRVPEARIHGLHLPEWGLTIPRVPLEGGPAITIKHHNVPVGSLVRTMRSVDRFDLNLMRLQCRIGYYEDLLPTFRQTFPASRGEGGGEHELAFHVRGGDIFSVPHANYMPVPLALYEMLSRETGLRPVFVGQIEANRYCDALQRRFPEARFVASGKAIDDFRYLRNSVHIGLAVSTFSWLAAWLSETARTVYLPVMGLFHPGARPEIDLLPRSDPRYVFIASNLLSWGGTPSELDRLMTSPASAFGFRRASIHPLFLGLRHAPRQFWLSLYRRARTARHLRQIRRASRAANRRPKAGAS